MHRDKCAQVHRRKTRQANVEILRSMFKELMEIHFELVFMCATSLKKWTLKGGTSEVSRAYKNSFTQ